MGLAWFSSQLLSSYQEAAYIQCKWTSGAMLHELYLPKQTGGQVWPQAGSLLTLASDRAWHIVGTHWKVKSYCMKEWTKDRHDDTCRTSQLFSLRLWNKQIAWAFYLLGFVRFFWLFFFCVSLCLKVTPRLKLEWCLRLPQTEINKSFSQ